MTGKEALDKLEDGFTLRRIAWKPDIKCRAYFSDVKQVPEYVPDDPEFENYISLFDALDNGEFLMDDWEVVDEII
jgi:Holliday junction resolvase RusA-like endonuclease